MTVRLEELLAAAPPGPYEPMVRSSVWFWSPKEERGLPMECFEAKAELMALAPDAVRLLIDMGWVLRQIENLVNHDYRLKHHDHTFVFNTIQQVVDSDDVPALLARLDKLGT